MRRHHVGSLASITTIASIVALHACVGDDPVLTVTPDSATSQDGAASDGTASDGAASDGSDDASDDSPDVKVDGGCGSDFGAPQLFAPVHESASNNVYPRPNSRGIFFGSDRYAPPADLSDFSKIDIHFLPQLDAGFGPPQRITSGPSGNAFAATESADGTTLYFDAVVGDGSTNRRLYRAKRQVPQGTYGPATMMLPFTDSNNELTPYLVGNVLYFVSDRGDGGIPFRRIHRVEVDDSGFVGTPTLVDGIEADWDVIAPVVTTDEKTIYFARIVTDSRVYVAARGSAGTLQSVTELAAVNTKPFTTPTSISADGCTLYLHQRANGERFTPTIAHR